ncbi:MAG: hypothetical protein NT029_21685 [Armatimonadetes bacterium]|nr:hypothetical protein [Armatimonadota bacterium]
MRTRARRSAWMWGCATVFLAATAAYGPALARGRVLLPADLVQLMRPWSVNYRSRFPDLRFAQNQLHGPIFEYTPWRSYARQSMRAGRVPLWNPYELTGNVLLANNQSAVLYPPNALLTLLPLAAGINAVALLHALVTGLLMFGLLRAWRLSTAASACGSVVWMLCGVQTVWLEFQTPTAALCWLPGALWGWSAWMARRRPPALAGSAACLALSLLAGHLQFSFYVALGFALFALVTSVVQQGLRGSLQAGWSLAPLAVAVALAAPALLPVTEMARTNYRSKAPSYAESIGLALPPVHLLTLVQPDLFGNPRDYVSVAPDGSARPGHPYWGKYDYIEYTIYMGVPALLLALLGVAGLKRRGLDGSGRRTSCGLAAGAVALLTAGLLLGLGTPVGAVLYALVPGYAQFHAPARAMALASFALALLAALGVDHAQGARPASHRALGIAVGVVVAALLTAFPGLGLAYPQLLSDQWLPYAGGAAVRALGFVALTAGALWALRGRRAAVAAWSLPVIAALDLCLWGAGFNPAVDPAMLGGSTRVGDVLKANGAARTLSLEAPEQGIKSFIVPNFNAVLGYREVQGADSMHSSRVHAFLADAAVRMGADPAAPFADPNTVRLRGARDVALDMLNVSLVTSPAEAPLDGLGLVRQEDAELVVWRNPRALGTAWLVRSARAVASAEEARRQVGAQGFDPCAVACVEGLGGDLSALGQGAVRLSEHSAHRQAFEVQSDAPGLLVMSEPAMAGWRATVQAGGSGAAPFRILIADGLLRAVRVPAGRSVVRLAYEPASYRVGLFVGLAALASMLGLIAAGVTARPRSPAA